MNSRPAASIAPRFVAVLALTAAVALGTSGCNLISTQATLIEYAPSDGISVPNSSGPLLLRNVLIVANDDGTDGNLVAAIVNETDETQTLNIEYGEGSATTRETVRVPAGENISLGTEDTEPLLLEGIDTKPGSDISVFFQSGDGEGALVLVPVLDGSLDYLSDLVPE